MATNASKPSKTPLFDLAIDSKDAASFEAAARAAGHTQASFSANVDWDWYYGSVEHYIERHEDGAEDGSTYVVLEALGLYQGMDEDTLDAYLAERKEAMGAGAADRLAKAREKAQKANKVQGNLIMLLAKQLGLSDEALAELKAEAEAAAV